MKRILIAAFAAAGLATAAHAQTASDLPLEPENPNLNISHSQLGTDMPSTGPVGESNNDDGYNSGLSPVTPNVTDMDRPGEGLSGAESPSTGLTNQTDVNDATRSGDDLGLPEVGTPSPAVNGPDVSGNEQPTTVPDVNR